MMSNWAPNPGPGSETPSAHPDPPPNARKRWSSPPGRVDNSMWEWGIYPPKAPHTAPELSRAPSAASSQPSDRNPTASELAFALLTTTYQSWRDRRGLLPLPRPATTPMLTFAPADTNTAPGQTGPRIRPARVDPIFANMCRTRLSVDLAHFQHNRDKDALVRHLLYRFDELVTDGKMFARIAPLGLSVQWPEGMSSTCGFVTTGHLARHTKHKIVTAAAREWRLASGGAIKELGDGIVAGRLGSVASFHLFNTVVLGLSDERLHQSPARIVSVVAHEFCHLAASVVSGAMGCGHSGPFVDWAERVSAAFPGIAVTQYADFAIVPRLRYRCVTCGKGWPSRQDGASARCPDCCVRYDEWPCRVNWSAEEVAGWRQCLEAVQRRGLRAYALPPNFGVIVDTDPGPAKTVGPRTGPGPGDGTAWWTPDADAQMYAEYPFLKDVFYPAVPYAERPVCVSSERYAKMVNPPAGTPGATPAAGGPGALPGCPPANGQPAEVTAACLCVCYPAPTDWQTEQ